MIDKSWASSELSGGLVLAFFKKLRCWLNIEHRAGYDMEKLKLKFNCMFQIFLALKGSSNFSDLYGMGSDKKWRSIRKLGLNQMPLFPYLYIFLCLSQSLYLSLYPSLSKLKPYYQKTYFARFIMIWLFSS